MATETSGTVDGHGALNTLQELISGRIEALRESLEGLLASASEPPHRPQQLARSLGINVTLASRLLSALRAEDPLEAAHAMPGPEALRSVVEAASARGAGVDLIRSGERAVHEFERLIREEFGSRSALDALIADALPTAGAKFQLANRQAMFKAAAGLKGVQAEVSFSTALVLPSEDPLQCSVVFLGGYLGLRRLRPGAPVRLQVRTFNPSSRPEAEFSTIGGEPVDPSGRAALVEEFCSQPIPRIEVEQGRGTLCHMLADERVGVASSADVVFGERLASRFRRYQPDGTHERIRRVWLSNETEIPCRTLILDLLLAPEIWTGCTPELRVYDTVIRGTAVPNDPARELDLLPGEEVVRFLGRGLRRFRVGEVPRYTEMLESVCARIGCDGGALRGYRSHIRYPFYGSQTMILVDPPVMDAQVPRAEGAG